MKRKSYFLILLMMLGLLSLGGNAGCGDSPPKSVETRADAKCGNGTVDAGEVCDGAALSGESCASKGFASGPLKCASDCKGFDTRQCVSHESAVQCGNNKIESGE